MTGAFEFAMNRQPQDERLRLSAAQHVSSRSVAAAVALTRLPAALIQILRSAADRMRTPTKQPFAFCSRCIHRQHSEQRDVVDAMPPA